MDIQNLIEEARSLLVEAKAAVEEDNLELASEKQTEYDALSAKIKALKAASDADAELDELTPEEKETEKGHAVRMPFETGDDEPDEDPDDFSKSFYVMKYGSLESAEKAVLKDLYGPNYMQLRSNQMGAFIKYIRSGRLTLDEEGLLQQVILLPEQVRNEIKAGVPSVNALKVDLQENILDLGGYTVPEDFRATLIKRLMGLTVVRGRAMNVTTVRDAVEWPKLEGGNARYTSAVRVTWVDEIPASATTAQTNPTFGMLRVPVHTVMARTDLSRNLLEDSAFNLLDVVAGLFAEAMAVDEDEQFLIGTGGGRPRGVLGKRSGANEDPDDGITARNSGNASALTADGLVDLAYGIDSQYRDGAVFVVAKNTARDIRKLKDGNGDYLWQRGLQPGQPDLLLGYPMAESEAMPAVAANNHPIIHGNFRGYMIVDRVGMTVERVQDTTTVGTNKVALFARRRLGGQVIEPWRFNVQKVSA
jgi:HK97 family phage major capsid protein